MKASILWRRRQNTMVLTRRPGMLDEFGEKCVIDTPISELGFAGIGVGSSMTEMDPLSSLTQLLPAGIDQIINNASK